MIAHRRERNREIQELHRGGMTLTELSSRFGLAPDTVYRIVRKRPKRPASSDVDPFAARKKRL